MGLNRFRQTKFIKIKSDKQIIKEQRINKLRQLEGLPLIDFGPTYKREEDNLFNLHSLLE